MAVRSSRPRKQNNYLIFTHEDIRYYLEAGSFQFKNVIYTAKKSILCGKLKVPIELIETKKTILIVCNGKGEYIFDVI